MLMQNYYKQNKKKKLDWNDELDLI